MKLRLGLPGPRDAIMHTGCQEGSGHAYADGDFHPGLRERGDRAAA